MRQALRFWRRHRAPAAWLTLGLALGVVGAAWAIAGALWLRPLPYPDAARLVQLGWTFVAPTFEGIGPADAAMYADWRDRQSMFRSMAGFRGIAFTDLVTDHGVREMQAVQVTAGFFDVLGVTPVAGRLLQTGDGDAARPAAVIAEPLWRELFAANSRFPLEGVHLTWFGRDLPVTVVGVMAPGLRLPGWQGADVVRAARHPRLAMGSARGAGARTGRTASARRARARGPGRPAGHACLGVAAVRPSAAAHG